MLTLPLPHSDPAEVVAEVIDARTSLVPALPFAGPVDLSAALASPAEPLKFLVHPFLPEGRKIIAHGPAESAKSMTAMAWAAEVTRTGRNVLFVSQENPLDEDLRRIRLLRPDLAHFQFFHDAGLDLADPAHVAALPAVADHPALIVFDSLSSCWSGDDESNPEFARFDAEVWTPLRSLGATVLVLDHVGHPQPGRRGVHAGRGASNKGQKADGVLIFRAGAETSFSIEVGKMRGDRKRPAMPFSFVDTSEGIELRPGGSPDGEALTFTQERILAALAGSSEQNPMGVRAIGDALANDDRGKALRRETIQRNLAALAEAGRLNGIDQGERKAGLWWLL